MIDWKRIKVALVGPVKGLMLMAYGAFLLMVYIEFAKPELAKSLHSISEVLRFICLGLLLVRSVLQSKQERNQTYFDPPPHWIAVACILAIGLAIAGGALITGSYVGAAITALITLLAASAVWRWAKANAAKIGEARFDTSHNPS